MAYLELAGVTKRYRGSPAVDGLSLSVERGEMLCLLGPSGCGKTTTLRIIAGFERTDGGAVRLAGIDVTGLPPEERGIGQVFQNYALFPHMTVAQNVGYGLRMRRKPAAEISRAVQAALDLVQLPQLGRRYPRELSGGQQQRVALARAVAIRPRLLLLDEPLSNLDAKLRDSMREEIRRIQQEVGITAVFVTHDQGEALAMADRMAVMDKGRIVQVDTPDRVYARPAHPFIAGFIGQANLLGGRILTCGGGRAALALGSGAVLQGLTESPLVPGQDAVAVVKTDRVRLSAEPAGLRVRVEVRTYAGASVVFGCASPDQAIRAVVPSGEEAGIHPGADLYASWSDADCLIIPGSVEAAA